MKKLPGALILTTLLLVISGCAGGAPVLVSSGTNDLHTMLTAAQMATAGDMKITVRHEGVYRPGRDAVELNGWGTKISSALGLTPAGIEQAGGVALFRAAGSVPESGVVTMMLTGTKGEDAGRLMIKLESGEKWHPQALENWQAKTGEKLRQLGIKESWTIMAQGTLNSAYADVKTMPEGIVEKLETDLEARAVERYADQGTLSVSFNSKKFGASVQSGANRVSLQAALHRVTDTGIWRITLGTPLITSEY